MPPPPQKKKKREKKKRRNSSPAPLPQEKRTRIKVVRKTEHNTHTIGKKKGGGGEGGRGGGGGEREGWKQNKKLSHAPVVSLDKFCSSAGRIIYVGVGGVGWGGGWLGGEREGGIQ